MFYSKGTAVGVVACLAWLAQAQENPLAIPGAKSSESPTYYRELAQATPAFAATGASETVAASGSLQAGPRSVWKDEVGGGFRKGTTEVGIAGGYGFGMKVLGSTEAHDLVFADIHAGRIFTDPVATNSIFRGNWEAVGQAFGGVQVRPRHAYFTGINISPRYDFALCNRMVLFIGPGAGLSLTDIGGPDLSTTFEFNLQFGGGLHWFFCDNTALTLEYRYLHLSNAGIDQPNLGVNSSLILLGVNRFF